MRERNDITSRYHRSIPGGRSRLNGGAGVGDSYLPNRSKWVCGDRFDSADYSLWASGLGAGFSLYFRDHTGIGDRFNADRLIDSVLCKSVIESLDGEWGYSYFEQRHHSRHFFSKRLEYADSECHQRSIGDGSGDFIGQCSKRANGQRYERSVSHGTGNVFSQRHIQRGSCHKRDRQLADHFEHSVFRRSKLCSVVDERSPIGHEQPERQCNERPSSQYHKLDTVLCSSVVGAVVSQHRFHDHSISECVEYRWISGIDRRYWSASGWDSRRCRRKNRRSAKRSSTSQCSFSRRGVFSRVSSNDYSGGESPSCCIGFGGTDHHLLIQPARADRAAGDFDVNGLSDDRDNHSYKLLGDVPGSLLSDHHDEWFGGRKLAIEGCYRDHNTDLRVQHAGNCWICSRSSISATTETRVGESELDASVLWNKHHGPYRVAIYEYPMT